MNMFLFILLWPLTKAAALGLIHPTVPALPNTSLCKVASKRLHWSGRIVRLHVRYSSDRLERDSLNDDNCPRIWFTPHFDMKKGDRRNLEAFTRAVYGDGRSLRTTDFIIDVIGRVSYRREGTSRGMIKILKVVNYHEVERPPFRL
jgi:hypothetical protein